MRAPQFTVRISALLLLLASVSVAGCTDRQESVPDPVADYPGYIRATTGLLCEKMLTCYEKIYRGLPAPDRALVTRETCEAAALENLEWKLARHTDEARGYSVICYRSLLNADCNQIAAVSAFDPGCLELRRRSDEMYAGFRPPPADRAER